MRKFGKPEILTWKTSLDLSNSTSLKGPERDDHILYASHTLWESEDHFTAWTKSEAFRKAHAGAGNRGHLYLGHPEFEGFETVDGASVG